MKLGDLKAEFRVRVQDTVCPYLWTNDEITPWFAEAESEAAIRARLLRDTVEQSITAGDSTPIDVPAALFDIQYAELRAADGRRLVLAPSSREAQDQTRPGWRQRIEPPSAYFHDDKTLRLNAVPDQDYTLYLEFFRTPTPLLIEDEDEPEIAAIHHRALIDWVEFRAYSKPDAETMNPGKATAAEARFIAVFGRRPTADLRRRQNANRPHRNRLVL